jgi:hypothetical protein
MAGDVEKGEAPTPLWEGRSGSAVFRMIVFGASGASVSQARRSRKMRERIVERALSTVIARTLASPGSAPARRRGSVSWASPTPTGSGSTTFLACWNGHLWEMSPSV